VLTNYLASYGYSSQWLWCPDITTPDNGLDIRRPTDIPSDASPGRWQAIPIEGLVTVPNMASLLLVEPQTSTSFAVQTLGYYGPGDGGGATYILTNSITGTNALGGKVLALGGAKSWQMQDSHDINVKQFGAYGTFDPATATGPDDTASIQAAMDWASSRNYMPVLMTVGTYSATSIELKGSPLRGDGGWFYRGSGTKLYHRVGATNDLLVNPTTATWVSGDKRPAPSIKDLHLIGALESCMLFNPFQKERIIQPLQRNLFLDHPCL
jgi:hypothetical protein